MENHGNNILPKKNDTMAQKKKITKGTTERRTTFRMYVTMFDL